MNGMNGMPPRGEGPSREFGSPERGYDQGGESDDSDAIDTQEIRGVDKARARLIPWLRRIVDSNEQQEPPEITLCQVASAAGSQAVDRFTHNFEETVDNTVSAILLRAVEDMETSDFRGQKITYSVVFERPDGKEVRQTFVLEMPRRRVLDDPPRRAYFPDGAGFQGQLMDQNLQLTEYALESASAGKDILVQMIADLRNENAILKRYQLEWYAQIQKMMKGDVERQIMVEDHRANIESKAKFSEGVKNALPALLGVLGGPNAAAALAMFQQQTGGAAGLLGGATGMGASGGASGGSDLELIDDLIGELENDKGFLERLFVLMGEKPKAFQALAMLHQSSSARRELRARIQAEQAAAQRQGGDGNGRTA